MHFQGVYLMYHHSLVKDFSFGCILGMPKTHPLKNSERFLCYMAYLTKLIDFMDTIFIVLRKKFNQISFLHVYHHSLMAMVAWTIGIFYGAAGIHVITGILNAFVHCCMYLYYWLSSKYPKIKESKFKRYLTQLQLLQFIIIFCHGTLSLYFKPDCTYPQFLTYTIVLQSVVMMVLFGNFYRKAYLQTSSKKTKKLE